MAIWLPRFSIDLYTRRNQTNEGTPILLATTQHQRRVIAASCDTARSAGVAPGMPLAEARALLAGATPRVEPHDPDRQRSALRSLAVWANRFTPSAMPDEPDTVLLDLTGCARAAGGEPALLEAAAQGLNRLGLRSRIAIAPTFGCAWALARFGAPGSIIDRGHTRAALAPLPTAALRLPQATVQGLADVGIDRVEQLLAIPRAALPARFGDELLACLDRALGGGLYSRTETIDPVRSDPPPAFERVFQGPTDKPEAIELTVRDLLAAACDALARRERGTTALEIDLIRSDLGPERLRFMLARPSRDPKHLWSLIAPALERAHMGFGVEAVRLRCMRIEQIEHEQLHQHGIAAQPNTRAEAELVDALSNRLGHGRVTVARGRASHLPERGFGFVPAVHAPPHDTVEPPDRDRPSKLFSPALPAEIIALAPEGPIHRVRWRGGDVGVTCSIGPERLEPEWWRRGGSRRDYYRVRTEAGDWLWMVRTDGGGWLVHGIWA